MSVVAPVTGLDWYAPETVGAGGGVQALFEGVCGGVVEVQVPEQPRVPVLVVVMPQAFDALVRVQVEPYPGTVTGGAAGGVPVQVPEQLCVPAPATEVV